MKKTRNIKEIGLIIFLLVAVGSSLYFFTKTLSGSTKKVDEVSEKTFEEDLTESLESDPPQISSEELRNLIENNEKVTVINPENRENFFKKHIPGSISFPNDEVSANISSLPRDHTIVVTSSGSETGCNLSIRIARLLASEGFPDVRDHHDGWAGWEKHGFPAMTNNEINVPQVSVSDINQMLLDNEEMEIIDLRDPELFEQGHIDTAQNIPYFSYADKITTIPHNKLIVLYDSDGMKSNLIGNDLLQKKYIKIKSLVGGYDRWKLQKK